MVAVVITSPPHVPASLLPERQRLLTCAPHRFDGRNAIEGCFENLNRASPVAERRITRGRLAT